MEATGRELALQLSLPADWLVVPDAATLAAHMSGLRDGGQAVDESAVLALRNMVAMMATGEISSVAFGKVNGDTASSIGCSVVTRLRPPMSDEPLLQALDRMVKDGASRGADTSVVEFDNIDFAVRLAWPPKPIDAGRQVLLLEYLLPWPGLDSGLAMIAVSATGESVTTQTLRMLEELVEDVRFVNVGAPTAHEGHPLTRMTGSLAE